LARAFELLDTDGDEKINRRDLFRMFRSMLVTVISLCESLSDDIDLFRRYGEHLNSTALWLTDSVFDCAPPSLRNGSSISFSSIADWYSNEGFRVASWLELLDNRKWRFISSTYASPVV
jgi:hypothetical protein